MPSSKIFNDPVYGFVTVPYGILFDLIEDPYFQRLRRIKQVSLTHLVYPGALHTRFHHALGAYHLTTQAIQVLRNKGVAISPKEAEAVYIAILLHDIGHGPFSHTLERTLVQVRHEDLSSRFMELFNNRHGGALDMAMAIFKDHYPKRFLHQLVSGQLDMDRMDYLNRDSFFTGVYEGVIGYDRLIKMLTVHEDKLVVEEKGVYSVEKFLVARRLMYWQVYLHKTVLAAEQMLVRTLERARDLVRDGISLPCSASLHYFLRREVGPQDFGPDSPEALQQFAALDDFDIISALKAWTSAEDGLLAYLSRSILDRRLFRLELSNRPISDSLFEATRAMVRTWSPFDPDGLPKLVFRGKETNHAYSTAKDEIEILRKDGSMLPMSAYIDFDIPSRPVTKYYLCYPKEAVAHPVVPQD